MLIYLSSFLWKTEGNFTYYFPSKKFTNVRYDQAGSYTGK